jgi:hypothetical protein
MEENAQQQQKNPMEEVFGPVIYSYSREQAIADGVLVDVSKTAREAGFLWPFAMTAEVWRLIERIPKKYSHEDIAGRLWDVLMVARASIRRPQAQQNVIFFDVILHHDHGDKVRLKLHCGPGDKGEPVLTLMLPEQD